MRDSLSLAVDNVFKFGDTDIYPIPIENYVIKDRKDQAVRYCMDDPHKDLDTFRSQHPAFNLEGLSPAGYTGYRWATQIDPIWNLYFLACVIEIGESIESARLGPESVCAYRFAPDSSNAKLFHNEFNWNHFQERSRQLANTKKSKSSETNKYSNVLICDIADFYPRVYQHRMDAALDRLQIGNDIPSRIKKIYSDFSGIKSYGLPIGGPAARLLAELFLNPVDRLLQTNGIDFVRYCDDYHIFAENESEAHRHLAFLAQKLLSMEGLSLQKSKTRVMPVTEFLSNSELLTNDQDNPERSEFMKLRLKFDPYSSTAAEDYEELRNELTRFDILDLLTSELNKSRIHRAAASHIVNAVRYLSIPAREKACLSIVDSLDVLAPIFALVMRTLKDLMADLGDTTKAELCATLRRKIERRSHLVAVDSNLAYAVRVLAQHHNTENETLLTQIYRSPISSLVRKDILIAMARWECAHFIDDAKLSYTQEDPWVQRALIVASYSIGEAGSHWRRSLRNVNGLHLIVKDWMTDRITTHSQSTLPL